MKIAQGFSPLAVSMARSALCKGTGLLLPFNDIPTPQLILATSALHRAQMSSSLFSRIPWNTILSRIVKLVRIICFEKPQAALILRVRRQTFQKAISSPLLDWPVLLPRCDDHAGPYGRNYTCDSR